MCPSTPGVLAPPNNSALNSAVNICSRLEGGQRIFSEELFAIQDLLRFVQATRIKESEKTKEPNNA